MSGLAITNATSRDVCPAAETNRERLRRAGVFTVNVVGGPGCGKTSLIDATVERLRPDHRVGVITCETMSQRELGRLTCAGRGVVQVNTRDHRPPDASDIHAALARLDLTSIELLFIENVGSLVGPVADDLGQEVTAAIFSVAGGHDKAEKHPELVEAAGVVVLNKTDLLSSVPFDSQAFHTEVARLNSTAPLFEISALQARGIEGWIKWLKSQIATDAAVPSLWFG